MPLNDRRRRRKQQNVVRYKLLGTVRLGYRCYTCKECETKRIPFMGNPARCPECENVKSFPDDYKYFYTMEAGHFVLKDAPDFVKVAGEKPTELKITFPFPQIEKCVSGFYMVWGGGLPLCKGNGDHVIEAWPMVITRDKDKDRLRVKGGVGPSQVRDGIAQQAFDWNGIHFERGDTVPCPGQAADMYPQCEICKANMDLRFTPADESIYRFGYYRLSSTSAENYDTMEELLGDVLESLGPEIFTLIPFTLSLVEKTRSYFDAKAGKRRRSDHYYLQLEAPPEILQAMRRKRLEAVMQGSVPQLPMPVDIPNEQIIDIEPPPPHIQIIEETTPFVPSADEGFTCSVWTTFIELTQRGKSLGLVIPQPDNTTAPEKMAAINTVLLKHVTSVEDGGDISDVRKSVFLDIGEILRS